MSNKIIFRLSSLIRKQYKHFNNNWSHLAAAIKGANSNKLKIDRRKLQRLANGDKRVNLSIDELTALQVFFLGKGVSCSENLLFTQPVSLFDMLEGEVELTIFIPTYYVKEKQIESASRWDVRALECILRAPSVRNTQINLEDVYHYSTALDGKELRRALEEERWRVSLQGDHALLTIGSPFSNYSTELLLCQLLGITTPFEELSAYTEPHLPFYFFWPRKQRTSSSCFSIEKEQVRELCNVNINKIGEEDRGVVLNKKFYIAKRKGESFNLIAAQYQENGHLAVVMSAIYAPGSYGIAQFMAQSCIQTLLPEFRPKEPRPLLIILVRTVIDVRDDKSGKHSVINVYRDDRTLRSEKISIETSQLWHCKDSIWQCQTI